MKIKQFEIWIADLNPRSGTETGKIRPVIIIQSDLLNEFHPSTIICPLTTNVQPEAKVLRIHLKKGIAKLKEDCDILIDQVRSIDNRRFQKKIGIIPEEIQNEIKQSLNVIFDLQ